MEEIFHPILMDEEDVFDDLFILHVLNDDELLGRRADLYGHFSLDWYTNRLCDERFRFLKADLPRLARALRIPDPFISKGVSMPAIHALCILLRRMTYPNRLVDLEPMFGFSSTVLSNVFIDLTELLEDTFHHLFDNLGHIPFLNHDKLREYAQAITQKGCPLRNCWGFIDGTARAICRPLLDQEAYYSGHKKMHCVKYQSVCTPDGLIISLKGAYEGRRHDAGILRESQFLEELAENVVFPEEEFVLYGDEGYGLHNLLIRPYTQHQILQNPQRQNFNNAMRSMRVTVEWGFGKVINIFSFLDFKKNQKLLLQDVSKIYRVAALLTNCHTCLYGSNTGTYFNINPPVLEEYLA